MGGSITGQKLGQKLQGLVLAQSTVLVQVIIVTSSDLYDKTELQMLSSVTLNS